MTMGNFVASNNIKVIWKWKKDNSSHCQLLTVIRENKQGLFSAIVGTLTLNGLNILDAKSFRHNESSMDVFKVLPVSHPSSIDRLLTLAKFDFESVVHGDYRVIKMARLKAMTNFKLCDHHLVPDITMRNNPLHYTEIEVSVTSDFPGILFLITDTLSQLDTLIYSAQIETVEGKVHDRFYIRKSNGNMLNDMEQIQIRNALMTKLSYQP